jgi:hypothetical protein
MKTKEEVMDPPTQATAGETPDAIESLTGLYASGIERVAEIQKKGLEFAVQQNAEVLAAWKKLVPYAPAALVLDMTKTTFERFADTQKGALDIFVEQTHNFVKLAKERQVNVDGSIEEGKKNAKEAIEQTVAAQKSALDYSAKQAKAAFETAEKQFGYAGTPAAAAADAVQRGIEIMVGAQKELVDTLAEPVLR